MRRRVRLGIVLFVIPFVFAFYPELLLIEDAFIADRLTSERIAMRPEGFSLAAFGSIFLRTLLAIFLLASGIARWERRALGRAEMLTRGMLAVGCLMTPVAVHVTAVAISAILLIRSRRSARATAAVRG